MLLFTTSLKTCVASLRTFASALSRIDALQTATSSSRSCASLSRAFVSPISGGAMDGRMHMAASKSHSPPSSRRTARSGWAPLMSNTIADYRKMRICARPKPSRQAVHNLGKFAVVGRLDRLADFERDVERTIGVHLRIGHENKAPSKFAGTRGPENPEFRDRILELCEPDIEVWRRFLENAPAPPCASKPLAVRSPDRSLIRSGDCAHALLVTTNDGSHNGSSAPVLDSGTQIKIPSTATRARHSCGVTMLIVGSSLDGAKPIPASIKDRTA